MKNIANIETVDKSRHATLKVKHDPDYAHAKALNMVGVTLAELSPCASNFVVMFVQNPGDSEFRMAVLLGLIPGENVYFARGGWDTTYLPLLVVSDPFMIGYDDRLGDEDKNLATCLDMTSASLSETDGMALFDDEGKETDFLISRHALLNELFEEDRHTDLFSRKMRELGLLRPFEVVLHRQDGNHRRFTDMFTLDQDKMKQLSAEQLQELHQLNFLPACYIILSSIYQMNKLMQLRNKKLADKVDGFSIHFPTAQ